MKANNGTGNTVERDEWETPHELLDNLDKQYEFRFDCCCIPQNQKFTIGSSNFLTIYVDISWVCWMNPPFSKAKEMFEHFFNAVKKGVAIYRCDNMETAIWQDVILTQADWIFIPKGRVNYKGFDGKSARFPSALIGVGVEPPKYVEGVCLKVER